MVHDSDLAQVVRTMLPMAPDLDLLVQVEEELAEEEEQIGEQVHHTVSRVLEAVAGEVFWDGARVRLC